MFSSDFYYQYHYWTDGLKTHRKKFLSTCKLISGHKALDSHKSAAKCIQGTSIQYT